MENVLEKESDDKSPHSKSVDSLRTITNTVDQHPTTLDSRKLAEER
jgi:hypothetical protein